MSLFTDLHLRQKMMCFPRGGRVRQERPVPFFAIFTSFDNHGSRFRNHAVAGDRGAQKVKRSKTISAACLWKLSTVSLSITLLR